MTRPIFVIGKNRSGTKWLSNIISLHYKVASIQRKGAGGILETNVFSNFPEIFGDLNHDNNFIGFVECFSQTNFFKLTGLEKEELYQAPRDYVDFFEYLMNLYAENSGADYWLQKTSPHNFEMLYEQFPEARFLVIERNPVDNIRSSIGLKKKKYIQHNKALGGFSKNILAEIMTYFYQIKLANKFNGKSNVKFIKFHDLKKQKSETVRDICVFLDLEFSEKLLKDKYKKNTSFNGEVSKEEILSGADKTLIRTLEPVLRHLPFQFFESLRWIKRTLGNNYHKDRFITKTFKYRKRELNEEGADLEFD